MNINILEAGRIASILSKASNKEWHIGQLLRSPKGIADQFKTHERVIYVIKDEDHHVYVGKIPEIPKKATLTDILKIIKHLEKNLTVLPRNYLPK